MVNRFLQNWGITTEGLGGLLALVGGALVLLVGPLNLQVGYLLLVISLDLILGIRVARKKGDFSLWYTIKRTSEKLFIYTVWISVFHALDMVARLPGTARWMCILALLTQEIASALRNTHKLGHTTLGAALTDVWQNVSKFLLNAKGGPPDATP